VNDDRDLWVYFWLVVAIMLGAATAVTFGVFGGD